MSPILADPAEFSALVQHFFADRLLQQQAVSSRTVAAYRDTFRLLLGYAERKLGKPPVKLALRDFDAELILDFLEHLEAERHNTVRSRNARLAAVRAFVRYVAVQCPPALLIIQRILAIPMKRFDKPLLGFLSGNEVHALLTAPDPTNVIWNLKSHHRYVCKDRTGREHGDATVSVAPGAEHLPAYAASHDRYAPTAVRRRPHRHCLVARTRKPCNDSQLRRSGPSHEGTRPGCGCTS